MGRRVSLGLTALFVLSACADEPRSPLAPDRPTASPAERLQQVDFREALDAQARYGDDLMRIPGVVGHAVGLDETGEPAVTVFTLTPDVAGIPERVDGVRTETVASGMFVALTDETARFRPAPLGVSIGHPDITAGTLGFKVTDGTSSFILSNNHVMANSNDASIGDNILQPGPADGGSDPSDAIGTLADFVEIRFDGSANTVDAAIASVSSADVLTATPADEGYGQPSSTTVVASPLMEVQKYGRTTGHRVGSVDATNATVDVCYETRGPFRCKSEARFTGQIIITPGSFSAGGDSGSGIVTTNGNHPVGLLFAGGSDFTIANPIDAVLSAFGVTIDDGSGGGDPSNTAPTADDVTASGDEDALSIAWTPSVGDADGDPLTCSPASGPADGSASVSADCSGGSYTPNADFNGDDTFTYAVSDGNGGSDLGTVTVTVHPVNDAPTASDDAYAATVGSVLDVSAPGVLENDADVDGDALTATLALDSGPSNAASFTLNADGSFSYESDGTTGDDSFTYTASDGSLSSGLATVVISVTDQPAALAVEAIAPNSASTNETVAVTITGSGFAAGAGVSLENGSGPAPDVSNVVVVDANTITATISVRGGGPPRARVWDVRVTNPDGATDVLVGGFTVNP